MLEQKTIDKIKQAMTCYPNKQSVCMSALRFAQMDDPDNHLTREAMGEIANILEIEPIKVHEVAAFYSMYNLRPVGRYHIQVCANLPCSLLGAEHIVSYIENMLNIKVGETTADKKFTLSTVECLGSCDTAPMMMINLDYYEDLTEERVKDILGGLQ